MREPRVGARRRRGAAAPHRGGRAGARRPARRAASTSRPRRRRRAWRRSIRSRTPAPAPTTAATSCAPWSRAARWSRRPHEHETGELTAALATTNGSASRSSGWRIRRWSPAAAASPATSPFRTSSTCASCAPTTRTAASCSIDTAAARALPGVVAVWTAADIADVPPIDFREGRIEKLEPYRQPVLATDKVRYRRRAGGGGVRRGPLCRRGRRRTRRRWRSRSCRRCSSAADEPGEFVARPQHRGGDHPPGLRRRRRGVARPRRMMVELELAIGRHSGVPLETRGAIGRYDASRDMLELHGAAKVPHRNRELLARMLRRAPSSMHVHESHVGGGFGIRGELYPEDVLVCVAAMRLGRPVKWIEDRREHLIAANHSRQQRTRSRAGGRRRGPHPRHRRRLSSTTRAPMCAPTRRASRTMTCGMLPGPYRVPGLSRGRPLPPDQQDAGRDLSRARPLRDHLRARAAGRRHRRTSSARSRSRCAGATPSPVDEMPYHRPLEALGEEIEHDSGDYHRRCSTSSLVALDWDKLKAELARRRADGETGRRRPCDVRREERARPRRRRAHRGRHLGHGRGHHRRRLARPGLRDRDGAGLRRDARRRLPQGARHPRPDRPHRVRHRRARLARHRDDRVGDARRRAQGARQGDRDGGRADAGAAPTRSTSSTARWCARIGRRARR